MILPISLTIAGAAALLSTWIARRVGQVRMARKISVGDGGDEALIARMRAHANFVEYTPLFLILLALVELAVGSKTWLWIVAVVFIIGRILHVFGMDRPRPDRLRLRMIATVITMLVLFGLAVYAIALPYLEGAAKPTITYASS